MGKKKKRKNKKPFSLFFWIAVILTISLIFLLKYQPIKERISDLREKNNTETPITEIESPKTTPQPPIKQQPKEEKKDDMINISIIPKEEKKKQELPKETPQEAVSKEKSYIAGIYFLSVNDDAEISLERVEKEIKYISTPLMNTLETMIGGLSSEEVARGLLNFIPQNTKLLSASVKNGTAYLNFSKEFLVDQFGRDGAKAKIMQIVYTATEFPTINDVQFLVDGEIKNYLNAEGINIGKPISRNSFK
ncbi:MAG: GerMN domain-containing protein [Spirochaetales bacterium]|nr:GerMN domain-containing protein [Spirochaetales bacterium]